MYKLKVLIELGITLMDSMGRADICKLILITECRMATYAAEDFGGQVLVKLADDDSHIVVLNKDRKRPHDLNAHSCT